MSLKQVDIIHIEDSLSITEAAAGLADEHDMVYKAASTLQDLHTILETSRARLYMVDGKFPLVPNGRIKNLAEQAVIDIRIAAGNEARIILVSGEMHSNQLAERLGIDCESKVDLGSTQEMMNKMKEILNNMDQSS